MKLVEKLALEIGDPMELEVSTSSSGAARHQSHRLIAVLPEVDSEHGIWD